MCIVKYSALVNMAETHSQACASPPYERVLNILASASPPYDRVRNISQYTFNNLFIIYLLH